MTQAIAPVQASLIHVIVGGAVERSYLVGDRYEPKATLNADECWVSSFHPTYGIDAICASLFLLRYRWRLIK